MIRLPDWVFESAAQEMRVMEQDATPHHQGLYLSENQVSMSEINVVCMRVILVLLQT